MKQIQESLRRGNAVIIRYSNSKKLQNYKYMLMRNQLVEEQTGANGKKTELVRNLKKNGMEEEIKYRLVFQEKIWIFSNKKILGGPI